MPIKETGRDWRHIFNQWVSLKRRAPGIIGGEAVSFYKQSFKRQGWLDGSLERWPPRKLREAKGRSKGKRGLLIQSGKLRRSIRVVKATKTHVVVGTDVPYAQIHNEGGRIRQTVKVKAHERTSKRGKRYDVSEHPRRVNIVIPRRQFMGRSKSLDGLIEERLTKEIKRIFK